MAWATFAVEWSRNFSPLRTCGSGATAVFALEMAEVGDQSILPYMRILANRLFALSGLHHVKKVHPP